ncbi:MAG TPA: cyclase family protein [Bryobacteraceae bacterium]|jgi:arylformamidase|nr:cyclase family protein [Bryobacteraceae bacterium]
MTDHWIDISVPLQAGMAHWPNDRQFDRQETLKIASGDECNLSEFSASAHIGTHMDAPRHYLAAGAGIESFPISAGVGRARVIAIHDRELIRLSELKPHRLSKGERILFKTRNSEECWTTSRFQEKFVYIPHETAAYLADCCIQTVGVDYLSVGGYDTDGPETHRTLLKAGIWIIEGLNLKDVEPGEYELICLPLKIVGSDGAPARAALRRVTSN